MDKGFKNSLQLVSDKIEKLATLLLSSSEGMKGIEEVKFICKILPFY